MRKNMLLLVLALGCSLAISMPIITPSVRADGMQAEVKVEPASMLLTEEGNQGMWIRVNIRLPEGQDVNNIDISSVILMINGVNVGWSAYDIQGNKLVTILERSSVKSLLLSMYGHMSPNAKQEVTFEASGTVHDGTLDVPFRGSDTIRVFIVESVEL